MAEDNEHGFPKSRVEALTDGLFATVMTILVLSLVVPIVTGPNQSQQLTAAISALLPNVFAYVASFIVLGIMWIGHNNLFRFIHTVDRRLQWMNILLLLCVGITPFSTAFLGKYPLQQPAIIIYGVNFLITATMFNVLTRHIMRHHRAVHKEADLKLVNNISRGNLLSVIVYALSLVLSFINVYASLALFILMPIYYIGRGLLNPA